MTGKKAKKPAAALDRRRFVQSVALAGAGLALVEGCGQPQRLKPKELPSSPKPAAGPQPKAAPKAEAPAAPAYDIKGEPINLACIGVGLQGRDCLIDALMKFRMPVRFKAICDIWDYNRDRTVKMLKKNGHPDAKGYADYQDLLAQEKDVEAVIVATPDFMHAEHACACLKAGKNVYCEKVMSNTLEGARQMVLTARETKRLLQIGHQRYSNPRYQHAVTKLLGEARLLGRITHGYGQWNRAARPDLGYGKDLEIPPETLKKYGYANMQEFRNWRHYKKYGGGPITDLGAHQVGVFGWFLGVPPKAVIASGGVDYYKNHEWYDNVLAILEYETPDGVTRVFYQTLTTTSAKGYFESLMGIDGTMTISEDPGKCKIFSEGHLVPEKSGDPHPWEKWVQKKYLARAKEEAEPKADEAKGNDPNEALLAAYKSKPPVPWLLRVELEQSFHLPHLYNFFSAIRTGTPLNCPPEVAYANTVTVLKINDAVAAGRRVEFKPEEFTV